MADAGSIATYIGRTPSPARRWAPFVMIAGGVVALGDVAQLVLNLVERHLLQQELTNGRSPAAVSRIRDAVTAIHTNTVTVFAAFVSGAITFAWVLQRRSRRRLARWGEAGVEASLRKVSQFVYWGA